MTQRLFANLSSEQRAVAQTVYRAALDACAPDSCPIAPVLESCVSDAVRQYADTRIRSHQHIFALRHVNRCIEAGTCEAPLSQGVG